MPLNQSLKGKEYTEVEFTVERDKVNQFARAIGENDPIYNDPEAAKAAGYPEQVAPPTFATALQMHTSGQVVLDPEMGLDYTRVVHGEQEFEYRRPLFVGDKLKATPRVSDVYAKGPNEFLVIESEIKDQSGETVIIARSTLLSRGTAEGA
ncbi:MAG: MaoC family dehydratase N-terminal domain-containing protein [Actinobacteria bacterium]|nr:MaoC family dehydratase N-terminal domain-containing protein [Actinomycetota bacterium]